MQASMSCVHFAGGRQRWIRHMLGSGFPSRGLDVAASSSAAVCSRSPTWGFCV
ncbi:hypothetical protein BTZ20_1527 [Rhodococcus sp. MTM3W5.2]|nr:hypothetical protein BTZ20_1527 [Rhodococcus sp. MTM3W5.2]